jgi:hypothetical protein
MKIDEVLVVDKKWRDRITKTLVQCYAKTPFFEMCWPSFDEAIRYSSESLDEINYCTFCVLVKWIGAGDVDIVRAGDLQCESGDATKRLIELCDAVGAKKYIAGKGGRNYLKMECFDEAGVEVIWQTYSPERVVYSQSGKVFIPGLSTIDCLFNIGPAKTRELILSAWRP